MTDRALHSERAVNIWSSFQRNVDPLARGATIVPAPSIEFDQIGGLTVPKEEILTYACAATSPEVYARWGTFPPSAMLMIGQRGSGKSLLAEALATQTQTSFVRVDVPRMVLDVIHGSGKVGELIQGWSAALEEMPPVTVLFDELEFSQAHDMGTRATELPIGPIMDFLFELIDRALATAHCLVLGSTAHPDTLPRAFLSPGRFERVVEVNPVFPADVIEALAVQINGAEGQFVPDQLRKRVVERRPDTGMQILVRRRFEAEFFKGVDDALRNAFVGIGQRAVKVEVNMSLHGV